MITGTDSVTRRTIPTVSERPVAHAGGGCSQRHLRGLHGGEFTGTRRLCLSGSLQKLL